MISMRCSVCGGPLPPERGTEFFPSKAPKLCGERCIRTAIEAYWERFGLRAIGEFHNSGAGLRYRLLRIVRPADPKSYQVVPGLIPQGRAE